MSIFINERRRRLLMKKYRISFSYSRNGKGWTTTSLTVNASSDMGAIAQIESKYPYVKNIRILSIS
jgi:hypothetical protein